jgi:hypothetical protein
MSFNWEKALAMASASMEQRALEAIILGPSGAGKSYLMGSTGVPTLYLYSTGESHGPRAAAARAKECGSTVLPICMDLDEDGNRLNGDAVLARISTVLATVGLFEGLGIRAVAIDGAAELENYIRDSAAWIKLCKTKDGSHNSFAEPAATCALFRPIFNQLKDLQRTRGVHVMVSAMLDVKAYGELNEVVEAVPRAKGFSVCEMLIQQFGDVLVIGPLKKDGETRWRLQFMSDLSKSSVDPKLKVVKRTVNFNPRLNGVTPPAYVDADLRAVIELKKGS